MCDGFKFIEELAGNSSLMRADKPGTGPDEARTDEIECSDVISSVRLIHKTYTKKADREKQ
jgi:hypothetical protein